MARRRRRKRQSGFNLLAAAPWPVGVVAGIALFPAIRYGMPAVLARVDSPVLAMFARAGIAGVAAPLAWLFLGLCWLAAAIAGFRRWRDRAPAAARAGDAIAAAPRGSQSPSRLSRATLDEAGDGPARPTLANIDNLDWLQFEQLIADSFGYKGFVAETTADGADGGVDIVLRERDNVLLVQCKHWSGSRVGVKVARELYGVLHARGARRAIVVTSGGLTADARRFCEANAVHYIDRTGLVDVLDPRAMPASRAIDPDRDRRCPLCGSDMIECPVQATGRVFRGCVRYPHCRGTRAAPTAVSA